LDSVLCSAEKYVTAFKLLYYLIQSTQKGLIWHLCQLLEQKLELFVMIHLAGVFNKTTRVIAKREFFSRHFFGFKHVK